MSAAILGGCIAALAAIAYQLGVVLQAVEARVTAADQAWRAGLLTGLLRRRRWVAGTLLGMLGWPLHAGALLFAPLSVVQPALGIGLIVLLAFGARALGERVTRSECAAVAVICAGLVALALGAAGRPPVLSAGGSATVVLVVLGGLVLTLLTAARMGPRPAWGAPLVAGLCFAWSGLSTQLVVDAFHHGQWLAVIAWTAATGGASVLGMLAEMTALQRAPAIKVAPSVFVAQVVVPVLVAPLITVRALGHGAVGLGLTGLGLSLVVSAAVILMRGSRAVAAALEETAPTR